jgi:hypothetical protein
MRRSGIALSPFPFKLLQLGRRSAARSEGAAFRSGGASDGEGRLDWEPQGGPPLPIAIAAAYRHGMNLPPDQPSPPTPTKLKLTPEERRARYTDRLTTIRLRMLIFQELDARGITTPAEIGEALGMPAAEATKLLRGHQWREGDVALLQAAAARLGVQVPGL